MKARSAILMEKKKCAKSSVTEPRAVRQHRPRTGRFIQLPYRRNTRASPKGTLWNVRLSIPASLPRISPPWPISGSPRRSVLRNPPACREALFHRDQRAALASRGRRGRIDLFIELVDDLDQRVAGRDNE